MDALKKHRRTDYLTTFLVQTIFLDFALNCISFRSNFHDIWSWKHHSHSFNNEHNVLRIIVRPVDFEKNRENLQQDLCRVKEIQN